MKDTSIPKPQYTILFYGPDGPLELVSWPSSECFIGWGGGGGGFMGGRDNLVKWWRTLV